MILLDLSQFLITSVFAQMKPGSYNYSLDEDLLRHILLNSIRAVKVKNKEYGDVVIACDDKDYWRKRIFPYYKANRKKARDESGLDWNTIFQSLHKFKAELRENFPYKIVQVPHVEADDIIAVLCKEFHMNEDIVIASSDKDYLQLQKYRGVIQYNPITKKEMTCNNPESYLNEKIIKGDAGDGIPNCLSPDNTFVLGLRQKPITEKRMQQILSSVEQLDENTKRNYLRNKAIIDFDMIPSDIQAQILDEYDNQDSRDRKNLFNYFIEHKLKNLMEQIGDF
jgi:5'-3' exonuclease